AARKTNGALTMLVINKDATTNLTGQIALTNFVPGPAATVYSYGIPQDEAVRTNGPAALQDIQLGAFASASGNFNYSFAPYSITVLSFVAAAPTLVAQPLDSNGDFVFQLQGQAGVPYVIQTSTDLSQWSSVATNTLTSSTLNFTNAAVSGPDQQFWRAVWQ